MTYTLQLYFKNGEESQHPFHLGTDERVARQIAEEQWCRVRGVDLRAVTLMWNDYAQATPIGTFDGTAWSDGAPLHYPRIALATALDRLAALVEEQKVGHRHDPVFLRSEARSYRQSVFT